MKKSKLTIEFAANNTLERSHPVCGEGKRKKNFSVNFQLQFTTQIQFSALSILNYLFTAQDVPL